MSASIEEKAKVDGIASGGGNDMKSKLRKANEEIKNTKKALEESIKKVEELNKKLGEEMNARAKAEAEAVRAAKVIDNLQEILDIKKKEGGGFDNRNINSSKG